MLILENSGKIQIAPIQIVLDPLVNFNINFWTKIILPVVCFSYLKSHSLKVKTKFVFQTTKYLAE